MGFLESALEQYQSNIPAEERELQTILMHRRRYDAPSLLHCKQTVPT